ncbi:hypothetical protein [Paenibacillus sp. FSL K6-1558]|uniref:hypothetical protein n=1 Tax=Paenibacillus sp. FSL K6-1558 TaxID=2921473 RepID=UPI0030F8CEAC
MAKDEVLNYKVISAFNDKETEELIETGSLYAADQKRANVLRAAGVIAEDDEGQAIPKQSKTADSGKQDSKTQDDTAGGAPNADDTPKS